MRALILESSFTSVADVAAGMYVPSFLISDRFESLDALRDYEGPPRAIHGVRDEVIPVSPGRALAAAHPLAAARAWCSTRADTTTCPLRAPTTRRRSSATCGKQA